MTTRRFDSIESREMYVKRHIQNIKNEVIMIFEEGNNNKYFTSVDNFNIMYGPCAGSIDVDRIANMVIDLYDYDDDVMSPKIDKVFGYIVNVLKRLSISDIYVGVIRTLYLILNVCRRDGLYKLAILCEDICKRCLSDEEPYEIFPYHLYVILLRFQQTYTGDS